MSSTINAAGLAAAVAAWHAAAPLNLGTPPPPLDDASDPASAAVVAATAAWTATHEALELARSTHAGRFVASAGLTIRTLVDSDAENAAGIAGVVL